MHVLKIEVIGFVSCVEFYGPYCRDALYRMAIDHARARKRIDRIGDSADEVSCESNVYRCT